MDIARVVQESASVNHVRLVGNEAGDVYVPTYNWLSYFAPKFKKVSGIKMYHQFHFSSSSPGTVLCKEFSDSPGTVIVLLKEAWKPVATDLPQIVEPPGLSADRQWYLYEKIQPFCDEDFRDITCPLPLVPRPNRTPVTTPLASPVSSPTRRQSPFHRSTPLHNTEASEQHTGTNPPTKRARICTNCGVPGHNRRTGKQ